MMRWAVFAGLCAAPLHAETPYPEVGTTFVYETLTHQSGFEFAVQELTITVLHVQDDQVVYSYCVDDNPCSMNIRRDLIITDFGYYGPPVPPSDQMIEQMRASADALLVEVSDLSGTIFPLTDGQVITWSEAWRSEGFNEDYAMSLSQTCCTDPRLPRCQAKTSGCWNTALMPLAMVAAAEASLFMIRA